jgi:hypothetical protein
VGLQGDELLKFRGGMRGDFCVVPAFVEESTDTIGFSARKVLIQPSETRRMRKFLRFVRAFCREFEVFFLVWR